MADEPRLIGNAFVCQYYPILTRTPGLVQAFYHESSVLSRSEEDGSMTTVTTLEGINKKILSLNFTSYRIEILSVDTQPSHEEGLMVVVTGCLKGMDNRKRKFTQSFFLAPQENGYFISNDVFRYVDEYKSVDEDVNAAAAADDDDFVPVNEAADGSTPTEPTVNSYTWKGKLVHQLRRLTLRT